jgi:eukaryotic-like serine/threonine-protein kinase
VPLPSGNSRDRRPREASPWIESHSPLMTLATGTRLGPYEVLSPLGAGGMGEVYRAKDPRLGRDVAIKVLPEEFFEDSDRVARFGREARSLASLNHPGIAAVHSFEEVSGQHILVMELVEGEDLGQRLAAGALPLEDSLSFAKQIAEALEAAHEKGIVHRDLKPANVEVTPNGGVKLLDFGLAKAFEGDGGPSSAPSITHSPTLTARATAAGVILGTAAYMSPEQARGKAVDKRSDVWAFGCVLYEMLAGKRAFAGETVSDTLAAVLTKEPDWAALPTTTPPRLTRLISRCLDRDPKTRLRDIGEARVALDRLISGTSDADDAVMRATAPAHAPRPAWQRALPWSIALVALLAAVVLGTTVAGLSRSRASEVRPHEARLQLVTPGGDGDPLLSPDGRQIAYLAKVEGGKGTQLWLRPLDSDRARPLPGTESGSLAFWSPDSRSIGFFAHQKLRRIDVTSGAVQTLCDAPTPRGGSWNRDGTIVFAPGGNGPLYRIPAMGGQPEPVTSMRSPQEASHRFPQFLPDGHHFLFWVIGTPEAQGVCVGSLDKPDHRRLLVADGPPTLMLPATILYSRESVLYAQRFDPERLTLSGEPVTVASGVSINRVEGRRVTASDDGLIAYRPDSSVRRQMTWVDRSGKTIGTVGEPMVGLRNGELSPDGRSLVITTLRGDAGDPELSLMDMSRGTLTRLTTAHGFAGHWSPDGTRFAFGGTLSGIIDLYAKAVGSNSPDELVYASKEAKNLTDWSPDGNYLLYSSQSPETARDVWAVRVSGSDRKPVPVAHTAAEETSGRFAPDGKRVAYVSDETGRREVFVTPFPGPGPSSRVSTGGGTAPFWRRDGKELYYAADDQLMAVSIGVGANGVLEIQLPHPLFKTRGTAVPTSDGQRFLLVDPLGDVDPVPLTVIVNWAAPER